MSNRDVFAIFPYLKTRERVPVRGILLRSSDDLEELSPEQQAHLKNLFAMFFLRENLHIKRMVYAHLELTEEVEAAQKLIWNLYDAQTILTYEYATPHPTMGDPFFRKEQTSIYVFTAGKIPTDLIWPRDEHVDYGVENLSEEEIPQDDNINGYNGILNGAIHFWVTPGNRIYPPIPHLSLNIHQDLGYDLMQSTERDRDWALADFICGYELKNAELEERLFTAMQWYNKSTSKGKDEEEVLLDLAVAFECLLNLEFTAQITSRFRETIMTLLGSVPRLDSWIEQFYNARSSVAHKGKVQHSMFYAMNWDKDRLSKVYAGKDSKVLPYRSLSAYGRRIFRLCLTAILSGARAAEDDGLSSMFVHNQERLEKILGQLSKGAVEPEVRLQSVAETVSDLDTHHWVSQDLVESETLVKVGISMIETYLETKPPLSPETETLLQEVLQKFKRRDTSADEKLEFSRRVVVSFNQGLSSNAPSRMFPSGSQTVSSFFSYMASPSFMTRKWMHQQRSIQPSSSSKDTSNSEISVENEGVTQTSPLEIKKPTDGASNA